MDPKESARARWLTRRALLAAPGRFTFIRERTSRTQAVADCAGALRGSDGGGEIFFQTFFV